MQNSKSSPISATISHPSLAEGRMAAQITIGSRELICKFGEQSMTFQLRGLKVTRGGANNKLTFLSHPSHPEWQIFTTDSNLHKELSRTTDEQLKVQLRVVKSSGYRAWSATFVVLGILILIILGAWFLRTPAIKLVASSIPPSWERKLGELVYAGIRTESKILENEELTKELTELLAPLTEVVKDSGYLNAFALPGGIVVVNQGTILKAPRLEVLLGVLAHEISHVTLQHSTRQIITVFGLYVVVDFVLGNIFGTIAAISQGATYLLQQGFSRESEHEADDSGFQLLIKANVSPQGMVDFFVLVRDYYKSLDLGPLGTLDKALNFLSTHPDTDSRIDFLNNRIKEMPALAKRELPEARFKEFQTKLQKVL
jgi:predicted Zn-dependent protease